jgi:hypothetical protein
VTSHGDGVTLCAEAQELAFEPTVDDAKPHAFILCARRCSTSAARPALPRRLPALRAEELGGPDPASRCALTENTQPAGSNEWERHRRSPSLFSFRS